MARWHARAPGRAVLASILLLGCSSAPEELPPLGEVLVVVDTDAPLPLVARLRVDVFGSDGTWIDSRDLSMSRADAWPGSFSVYAGEGVAARDAVVRLRAYPEGRLRDYLGERFARRPAPGDPAAFAPPLPEGDGQPRLVARGIDVTPRTEPDPALAIDRLILVHVVGGRRASARITLRSSCFGTMADLVGRQTCADAEALLLPLAPSPTSSDMTIPSGSAALGTAGALADCTTAPRAAGTATDGTPLFDEEVCVPGALFILGSRALVTGSPSEEVAEGSAPPDFGAVPEKLARIPPLLVDRFEVTVGRWRHAVSVDGFVAPDPSPEPHDAAFPTTVKGTAPQDLCTYSTTPLDREAFPVSCVTWDAARAFCRFYGGDLPTEAQWEFVATAAGRSVDTIHPWGNDSPSCDRSVYARSDDPANAFYDECLARGFGPQAVDSAESSADATPELGVVGLGANLAEWSLDAYRSYGSLCWASQPIADPRCWEEKAPYRSYRGGDWTNRAHTLRSVARRGLADGDLAGIIGFRCVRQGG